MAKQLRRMKKPINEQTGPYWVTVGTPHSQGPKVPCKTLDRAYTVACRPFEEKVLWCQRHNSAGEDAMHQAIVDVKSLVVGLEKKSVSAVADDYTGLTITVWLWRT